MSTNPTAQRILDTIEAEPGIHFRGLLRRLDLQSAGHLRYHLDRLARSDRVIEVPDGGFTRYFAARTYDRRTREQMLKLAHPLSKRIAKLLLNESLPRKNIRKRLRCPESTLGYHLSRMHQDGIVEKREHAHIKRYALADPDAIRRVLELQGTHAQEMRSRESPDRPRLQEADPL